MNGNGLNQIMPLLDDQQWVDRIVGIAKLAGERILDIYQGGEFGIERKSDDSPLTLADLASHREIVDTLGELTPHIPILSEESDGISLEERRSWGTYWLVDPLDGTKEFIDRNGEFTVNIALIVDAVARLGVVYVPVKDLCFLGIQGTDPQATRQEGQEPPSSIGIRRLGESDDLTLVASRRHGSEALQNLLAKLSSRVGTVTTVNMGSSLKLCLVAEGKADLYPRLAPTCEWDTAAAQAVVEAAGGLVVDTSFRPLKYNQKDALLNPSFYVLGDTEVHWQDWLS